MTPAQRKALELLAEHGTAAVSNKTRIADAGLSIHATLALALVRERLAAHVESRVAITDAGMRRAAQFQETPAQRRQRKASEALEAQASGDWVPAPAGAAAAADRAAADDRHHRAALVGEVNSHREEARFEREMADAARAWGAPEEAERYLRWAEEHDTAAATAQAELDDLRTEREATRR